MEQYKVALQDTSILKDNFSESIMQQLLDIIEEVNFIPQEMIYQEGDNENDLYFINDGQVEIVMDQSQDLYYNQSTSIKTFSKGQVFGELEFFTGNSRAFSVRSKDLTSIIKVNHQKFLKILEKSPEDKEVFAFIKDSIIFNKNYRKIGTQCYSCDNRSHFYRKCPYITYIPAKYKLIEQCNSNVEQIRQQKVQIHQKYDIIIRQKIGFKWSQIMENISKAAQLIQNYQQSFLEDQEWYDMLDVQQQEYLYLTNLQNSSEIDQIFNQDQLKLQQFPSINQNYQKYPSRISNQQNQEFPSSYISNSEIDNNIGSPLKQHKQKQSQMQGLENSVQIYEEKSNHLINNNKNSSKQNQYQKLQSNQQINSEKTIFHSRQNARNNSYVSQTNTKNNTNYTKQYNSISKNFQRGSNFDIIKSPTKKRKNTFSNNNKNENNNFYQNTNNMQLLNQQSNISLAQDKLSGYKYYLDLTKNQSYQQTQHQVLFENQNKSDLQFNDYESNFINYV